MSEKHIDHELTSNVVCPHCGYEDADWFDVYDGSSLMDEIEEHDIDIETLSGM